jgi:hypothetical protein
MNNPRVSQSMSVQSQPPQTPAPSSAMDIDAISSRRLSAEERQYRRTNRLCIVCGGAGHFKTNCIIARQNMAVNSLVQVSALF